MKGRAVDVLLLVAVMLACAALLYLDWRRQGEVELMYERLDALEGRLPVSFAGHSRQSTVERILRASDDRTLADIAREGA